VSAEISKNCGSRRIGRAIFDVCALVAVVAGLLAPSRAQAQVQPFSVNVPAASEHRDQTELTPDPTKAVGAQTCPEGYVRIEPGTFTMGSPPSEEGREADETQHRVTITRAYCMKATEVTQGEWQAVMGSNPSTFKNCGANCPVEQVTWDDAVGYANALSRREGLPECYSGSTFTGLGCEGYRLPTEAEWEYAARAGRKGSRYGNLDDVAWYGKNAGGTTHPVRLKQPNAWGVHDMLGNVFEWTGDWFGEYSGAASDPARAAVGSNRVVRGGSLGYEARFARAAFRLSQPGDMRYRDLGFRLVRAPIGAIASTDSAPAAPAAGASSGATGGCPAGYVRIAPGTFTMVSPPSEAGRGDDEPQHEVTITRAFCMKATEVTQREWQAEMGANPSDFPGCGPDCPVEQVSWDDAVLYANALTGREGLAACYTSSTFTGLDCTGYRLPTEAEWEYAARAGTTGASYQILENPEWILENVAILDSIAWYSGNSGETPHVVRQKQPNAWGLYDMLGNMWEWTADRYGPYPGPVTDPLGSATGSYRVRRGGSWNMGAGMVVVRYRARPDSRDDITGFRLVRAPLESFRRTEPAVAAPDADSSSGTARGCPAGYARIAPGTFMMGSPPGEEGRSDAETQHSVTITRGYCMKATEVTQGEWQAVMGSNPSWFKSCGANCPVEQVSWDDAVGYANAFSRREGLPECYAGSTFTNLGCMGYRLPTEAEWEYAARAGTTGSRHGNLESVAWHKENSGAAKHPGLTPPVSREQRLATSTRRSPAATFSVFALC
jgi:formylglycine-generating enzyme required for sulfatase activity